MLRPAAQQPARRSCSARTAARRAQRGWREVGVEFTQTGTLELNADVVRRGGRDRRRRTCGRSSPDAGGAFPAVGALLDAYSQGHGLHSEQQEPARTQQIASMDYADHRDAGSAGACSARALQRNSPRPTPRCPAEEPDRLAGQPRESSSSRLGSRDVFMMPSARGASQYLQTQVRSSTPLELVVLLYDGALRSSAAAREAIVRDRHPGARTAALSKAMAIIAELQNTLDMERGGTIAAASSTGSTPGSTSQLLDATVRAGRPSRSTRCGAARDSARRLAADRRASRSPEPAP